MKAIHNLDYFLLSYLTVVVYPKDTEKWKQFTTNGFNKCTEWRLLCIPKILKNESNSQPVVSTGQITIVVVYPKDTEKWKQFTTSRYEFVNYRQLLCIPKILKNESNSQLAAITVDLVRGCCVSQRYWKMKAIHNWSLHI